MSIRINNQTIAGNYEHKPTSYRYVGEIFQSAIPIEDTKVACLDGHKVYSDEGYGSFIQHLISQSVLYPQLVCTEEVWQEKVTQYGSWGQFVINTQENSVRLPKIAGFVQGLSSLENLANLIEAGLPNITGATWRIPTNSTTTTDAEGQFFGALYAANTVADRGFSPTAGRYGVTPYFDASRSNPIYGKSTTVQPQAIQYPYYIVLATGVVQTINVKEDVELNNPFSLLDSKYSPQELNNISWLKSEGQWNSNTIYPSVYELLVKIYNGTETQEGVSVKLVTESYTDYDFVINQADETFRLPLLNGEESLPGDRIDELTLGPTRSTYVAPANGIVVFSDKIGATGEAIVMGTCKVAELSDEKSNRILTVASNNSAQVGTAESIILPVRKDDIYYVSYNTTGGRNMFKFVYNKGNGSLYYYVGDTIQNANLVNVGRLVEVKANKTDVDGQWVNCNQIILSATSLTGTSNIIVDLSTVLPDDGYEYECNFSMDLTGDKSTNTTVRGALISDKGVYVRVAQVRSWGTSVASVSCGSCVLSIGLGRYIEVPRFSGYDGYGTAMVFLNAYRRLGKNV